MSPDPELQKTCKIMCVFDELIRRIVIKCSKVVSWVLYLMIH